MENTCGKLDSGINLTSWQGHRKIPSFFWHVLTDAKKSLEYGVFQALLHLLDGYKLIMPHI